MTPGSEINGRRVDCGYPVYIIAEMSGNHGQSLEQARRNCPCRQSLRSRCGQTANHTPGYAAIDCDNDYFRIEGHAVWHGRTLLRALRRNLCAGTGSRN